jgi:hypothetical protein
MQASILKSKRIAPLGERPKGFQGSGFVKTTFPLSLIDCLHIRQTRKFTRARVFTLCQGLTPAIAGCTSFTAFSRWLLPQFSPRFAIAQHRQKLHSQSTWTVDLFTRFARSKSALADSSITGVKPWLFRWRFITNSRRALAAPTTLSAWALLVFFKRSAALEWLAVFITIAPLAVLHFMKYSGLKSLAAERLSGLAEYRSTSFFLGKKSRFSRLVALNAHKKNRSFRTRFRPKHSERITLVFTHDLSFRIGALSPSLSLGRSITFASSDSRADPFKLIVCLGNENENTL